MNRSFRAQTYMLNQSLEHLQNYFSKHTFSKVFVLVDENTLAHCYTQLKSYLPTHNLIEITSGEQHKSLDTCQLIWEHLTNANADRNSILINVGGGVICDLGGFAAACYKRGIKFVNVPTTLLAMVDASVGGKTGVDFKDFKNQIGVFQDPQEVFIFTSFLNSLPHRQLLSGFAEVIKHYLIADTNAFNLLTDQIKTSNFLHLDFKPIVERNIEIKSTIVLQDPFENGNRKALNFGHTIGHAVESYFLNKNTAQLLHGEAIAIGLICESYLSQQLNFITAQQLNIITIFILSIYNLPTILEQDIEPILMLLKQDKKSNFDKNQFTLLADIGNYSINNYVQQEQIIQSIMYYNSAHV